MNATLINKALLMSFNTVNTDSLSLLGQSMFKNTNQEASKSSVKPTSCPGNNTSDGPGGLTSSNCILCRYNGSYNWAGDQAANVLKKALIYPATRQQKRETKQSSKQAVVGCTLADMIPKKGALSKTERQNQTTGFRSNCKPDIPPTYRFSVNQFLAVIADQF